MIDKSEISQFSLGITLLFTVFPCFGDEGDDIIDLLLPENIKDVRDDHFLTMSVIFKMRVLMTVITMMMTMLNLARKNIRAVSCFRVSNST